MPNEEPPVAEPPAPPGHLTAKSALIAFLDAPDWQSRRAYVLEPEVVTPAMESRAKEQGDGPIETTSIRLREVSGPNHFFQVATPEMPEGFPVCVIATDEGPMIDWETFVGFQDDLFRKFAGGPADRRAILDLLVKPTVDEAAGHFVRFRLSVPMPGREADAWIRRDATAFARLRAIFDGSGGIDEEMVNRLVNEEQGLPLVLALVKRETGDGRDFIEIEDLVAIGWGPPP